MLSQILGEGGGGKYIRQQITDIWGGGGNDNYDCRDISWFNEVDRGRQGGCINKYGMEGIVTRHWTDHFCLQFFMERHLRHRQIENSAVVPSDGYILMNAIDVKSSGVEIGRSGTYDGIVHSLSVYDSSLYVSKGISLFLGGMPPSHLVTQKL